jgi:hypothetical protein
MMDDDQILELQEKYIEEHYPDAPVNYGWAVDDVLGQYSSKIYGHGVLTTDMKTGKHTFSEL